jgi:hypothetical protein
MTIRKTIKGLAALLLFMFAGTGVAITQQPQTQTAPISAVNAKYVNGVAPGYASRYGSVCSDGDCPAGKYR